jgi:Flp pilus assembly protein TadG
MKLINWRSKTNRKPAPRGFLARLARDRRGSTLAMMAGALIPMIGIIGSAVDISRAYLVKTRLQQACDAGVLAARRTMTGQTIVGDTNAQTQATNFFKINLKNGGYGATVVPIVVTDVNDTKGNPTGAVHGVASADVPTTLMKIFGKTKLTMIADCEAQLQVSNNDVMFVLDVTGSMNCAASDDDSTCADNGLVEKSNARIKALRTAVVSFFDTLNASTTAGSQLRIGFMPYSTTVNVGKLLPSAYITDNTTYQSRQRIITSYNAATSSYGSWSTTSTGAWGSWSNSSSTANITSAACTASVPASTTTYGATTTTSGTTTTDANGVKTTPLTDSRTGTDKQYKVGSWTKTSGSGTTAKGTCVIQVQSRTHVEQRTGTQTQTPVYSWSYGAISYDTSQFKLGNSVTTKTGNGFTDESWTWNGCIEERTTVPNATFPTIPSNAHDLQVDEIPFDASTQWRPHWPGLIWTNLGAGYVQMTTQNRNLWACPKEASKLAVRTHDDVYNYVNAADFKAVGYTYHDAGMIWGARFVSPTGIFASENAVAPNGKPVNRHIVFMTDGDMKPYQYTYSLYGHETLDRRVSGTTSPSDAELKARHNSRFSAICERAKNPGNVTIWVVAYAQSMTTELQNCASGNKYYYAQNDTQLQAAFQNIASQIAQLRLSK